MEKFQELRDLANKKLHLADYILTNTYPIVKDPKLLLSSVENLFLAFNYGISSLLQYGRIFKKIPPYQDNFKSKFNIFKDKYTNMQGIGIECIEVIQEIKEIIVAHKKSPMEFPRRESLVICNENYRMKTITPNTIKNYVDKAKIFIKTVSTITKNNESIFTR